MNKEHSYSKNIKEQKEILSQKVNDWKQNNYRPWMEHSFKPWKKQAIKELKRGKKSLMKKMELWKKDFLVRSIESSPNPDAPLQGSKLPILEPSGMTTLKVLKYSQSLELRRLF